jgi:hypothetical protein
MRMLDEREKRRGPLEKFFKLKTFKEHLDRDLFS